MSKFGRNYLNSADEQRMEALIDKLFTILKEIPNLDTNAENVVCNLRGVISDAYSKGYNEGVSRAYKAREGRTPKEVVDRDIFLEEKGLTEEFTAWHDAYERRPMRMIPTPEESD